MLILFILIFRWIDVLSHIIFFFWVVEGGGISKLAFNHIFKNTFFSGMMKMLWTFPPFPEVRTYFRIF